MRIFLQSGEEVAESGRLGRAQLLANFVHELDDVWLGSREPSRSRNTAFMVQIRRIPAKSGFKVHTKNLAKSKQILAKI